MRCVTRFLTFCANALLNTVGREHANQYLDGIMDVNQWKQDAGKWFYLGADGAILKNAVTPDGYTVGADGVWIA